MAAQMDKPLGVVVVGVGIAGRVRIRDLRNEIPLPDTMLPGINLVGFVSRRELQIEGATQITLEDALKRDDVHVIFVCTENEKHEDITRKSLEAGKHVLVEFPIATTAEGATGLFTTAEQKGVVLYEEDISLLTPRHIKAKELIQEKGLKEITMTLRGRPNGWIEDISKSGSPFVSSINMIHQAVDLAGEVIPQEAHIVSGPKKYTASAKLVANNNVPVTFTYERGPDIERRQTSFTYILGDGTELNEKSIQKLLPQEDASKRSGLFLADTVQFMKIVRGETSATAHKERTLKGLEIADKLYQLAKTSPQSANLP